MKVKGRAITVEGPATDDDWRMHLEGGPNGLGLIPLLDDVFATKNREEWEAELAKYKDLIWERVQRSLDLLDDPQVVENNYVVEFDHPVVGPTKWPQTPLTYSKTPLSTRKMAPTHGENTEEILLERLGYTWDDIVPLKDDGVIL